MFRQECVVVPSLIGASNHEDNSVPAQVDSQESLPLIGSVVPFERTPLVLPTEIWERAIDWLVVIYTKTRSRNRDINLRRDLFHCALVCRDWRFRAQKHLYAYIRINAHALSQYETILRKTPILREFAQEFIFYNQYIWEPGNQSEHTDKTTETASHALRIALRLPNVRYFSVESVNLALEHPHLPRYMSLLRGIAHLGFASCTRIKLQHLARLIVALKDVSAVALHVPIFVGPESTHLPMCYYNARCSPTALYLRVYPGGYLLLDWLVKAQSFTASLRLLQIELTIQVTRAEMALIVQNIQALLVNCAKKVIHWRFWAWEKVDGLSTIPTVSLASQPNLRSLEFKVSRLWFDHMVKQLQTVSSRQVRGVALWYINEGLLDMPWEDIDNILNGNLFRFLANVTIKCTGKAAREVDQLPRLLPKLHKKGVLRW